MSVWAFLDLPLAAHRNSGGRIRISVLASILAAGLLGPISAHAACKDTFPTVFVTSDGVATPLQNAVPLGVGSSMNALMATMNTVNTAFLSPSSSFVSARGDAQPGQVGGGVWVRTVTGSAESKSTTTATIDTSQAKVFLPLEGKFVTFNTSIPGAGSCEGTLSEDYIGYQFGVDLAKLNIGGEGANFHFGLTAGYFNSKTKDKTVGGLAESTGSGGLIVLTPDGSFGAGAQVPFVGLYATLTKGNFFADALVRQDFYLMNFNDTVNGLLNQSQNANGVSVAGNLGYKIQLPSNWFIEPSGGALWSRVRVDTINSPGSQFYSGFNEGTVKIDDIESILGRATVRIGTTFAFGDVTWQPFLSGTVFHEFAGEATAKSQVTHPDFVTTGCTFNLGDCSGIWYNLSNQAMNTSTSRIGTFAQYGVGTAVVFGDSGWLGYSRFDYRSGDNIEGYSFNAGLRYHW